MFFAEVDVNNSKQSEVETVIQEDDTNFQVDERAGTSTFSIS